MEMRERTPVAVVRKVDFAAAQPVAEPGRAQYATALVPPGSRVEVVVMVDGEAKSTLGPWAATARAQCNPLVQVRVRVDDRCRLSTLAAPEPEPVEIP